jgi:hypothetical protein
MKYAFHHPTVNAPARGVLKNWDWSPRPLPSVLLRAFPPLGGVTWYFVGAALAVMIGLSAHGRADDLDTKHKLSLADLTEYRAALSGNPTAAGAQAADPPVRVEFRSLWDQPDTFRGRRVIVQGRVERIFRQAAVGSFPPLAEVWITSPAGDPFCVVFPQQELTTAIDKQVDADRGDKTTHNGTRPDKTPLTPDAGRTVRFTGTFLKMVSYAASDGKRLAPLIVGARPPIDKPDGTQRADATRLREGSAEVFRTVGGSNSPSRRDRWPRLPANWAMALALAAVAAGVISWQHLRTPARRHCSARQSQLILSDDDHPLEFIDDAREATNGPRTQDQ